MGEANGDKKVSDLIEEGATISWAGKTGKPQGIAKYVANYDKYPKSEQSGHYFPIKFDEKYYNQDLNVGSQNGVGGKDIKPTADDPYLIIRIENVTVENKVKVVMRDSKEEIFTLDFSDMKLALPLGKDAFDATKEDYGRFGNNTTYYKDGSLQLAWKDTTCTVTGEINYLDSEKIGQFSKLTKEGNYFAFALIQYFKGKQIEVANGGKSNKVSDTDFVCLVNKDNKTITVKCEDTLIATFNLDGVTLASNE